MSGDDEYQNSFCNEAFTADSLQIECTWCILVFQIMDMIYYLFNFSQKS